MKIRARTARAMAAAKPAELQVETELHGPAITFASDRIIPKKNRIPPTMVRILKFERGRYVPGLTVVIPLKGCMR
jgi:hypothetical protein